MPILGSALAESRLVYHKAYMLDDILILLKTFAEKIGVIAKCN
jgi:hypothetical protein